MTSFSKTLDVLSKLRDYMEAYPGEMLQDALYEVLGSQQHEHVENFMGLFVQEMGRSGIEDVSILDPGVKQALTTLIFNTAEAAKQEVPAFRIPSAPNPEVAQNLRGSQLNLEMLV